MKVFFFTIVQRFKNRKINQKKEQVDDQEIISNSEDELHILAHKLNKLICKYMITI
jgi:hypothetical protein